MTLRLPKFSYIAPRTLEEAAQVLADEGGRAMIVAGGTDLYPNMKRRQFTPEVLVGLRGIGELRGIASVTNGGAPALRIGAGATLTQVAASAEIQQRYAALATAASLVSTPQLRNMGTIGGNIFLDTRCNYYDQSDFWRRALGFCMKLPAALGGPLGERGQEGVPCRVALTSPTCLATFSSDTVPTLIGYDASIRLVSANGERHVPLRDFYRMDGMRWMKVEPGEILVEVTIPDPEGLRGTYLKLRDRGSFDFPLAGVFAGIRTDPDGVVDRARIVLTGVYSMPVAIEEAQAAVLGHRLEPDVINAAAEAAYAVSRPVDNTGGTIIQRRRTVRVFVRRALEELAAST
jgi:4-hydroxybenzoyl-CoA reductase subunit beta